MSARRIGIALTLTVVAALFGWDGYTDTAVLLGVVLLVIACAWALRDLRRRGECWSCGRRSALFASGLCVECRRRKESDVPRTW